jgi:hypothetical protein
MSEIIFNLVLNVPFKHALKSHVCFSIKSFHLYHISLHSSMFHITNIDVLFLSSKSYIFNIFSI